jgi:hypothetical protein
MKKLKKLELHNLEKICVDEQKSIKGGGDWEPIEGLSNYILGDVEITDNTPIKWACSNEYGVIIGGFVLEGPDGVGGLFGTGQNGGNLTKEKEQALINIGASILGFILNIAEPILVSADVLWKPQLDPHYLENFIGSDK